MMNSKSLFLSFLLISTFFCFSQKQRSIGFGLGINSYKGELSRYQYYTPQLKGVFNLNLEKRLSGQLVFRSSNIIAQRISDIAPAENYVKTSYIGVNYGLKFKVWEFKKKFSVSVVQGFGFIRFQPKSSLDEPLISKNNSRASNESYSNFGLYLPSSIELSWLTKYGILYSGDIAFLNTRTDYLDNYSMLGTDKNKDNIFYAGFTISFLLKKKSQINTESVN